MAMRVSEGVPFAQGCDVYIVAGRHHHQRARVVALHQHIPTHLEVRFFAPNGELSKSRDLIRRDDCKRVG
ncbi:hypothetical protein [Ralstonia mannitolilytica]|uniref:Uncharacterized protein n=1 Tax=Ralstonia mannitolilytica TaxID=105219 RepID=A0AAJ4ZNK2_9RALS|nr:hypothetical protein [Ralstonia mannitolilytica]QIF07484.1 hypothetical protein G5A69_07185 [Ralstonia mannitolilytica]CAG2149949.1 hypothetical protein LMG6866_03768 [Ralstonia mannitolilytica]CAJ0731749.1 hypothetical protein R77592_02771 [Ralstonia mannitolilytica]CAJ0781921.1 hypothetical protein R77555_00874 [Ralstonia mannitolilytica]SUD89126.1 Uncharacterised protein [Ralstonia mannitolilytica]